MGLNLKSPGRITTIIFGAILAFAVIMWQVTAHKLRVQQERTAQYALQADSLAAAHDTTKQLFLKVGREAAVFQRQAVQSKQLADDLDRQLKLERRAKTNLTLKIDSLRAELIASGATSVDSLDVRLADFAAYHRPYTILDSVWIPPPPLPAWSKLQITLDPLTMAIHQSCTPPNDAGIKSALVSIKVPTWAPLSIDSVTQDDDVCASPALQKKKSSTLKTIVSVALGFLLGRIF